MANLINFIIKKKMNNFDDVKDEYCVKYANQGIIKAAEYGNTKAVEICIKKGVNQNDLNLALSHAANQKHVETVKYLIKHGANNFDDAYSWAFVQWVNKLGIRKSYTEDSWIKDGDEIKNLLTKGIEFQQLLDK